MLNHIKRKMSTNLHRNLWRYFKHLHSPCFGEFEGFPKVRLVVGDKDPLHDDSIRVVEKMLNGQVDVKAKVYKNAINTLLRLDAKVGARQCRKVVDDSIDKIREMLED